MTLSKTTPDPLVSIVIPTFNQAEYLPACIDSCLFQSYSNIELIIVDGGSVDATKSYLSSLEHRIATTTYSPVSFMDDNNQPTRVTKLSYPQNRRIRIITHDTDIGATSTYNRGLSQCSGKYCTYVVGDDLIHPHMIEEMATLMETSDCDFTYSDMLLVKDSGEIVSQLKMPDYSFKNCFADWFKIGVSKLYKTSLHEKAGLMDEKYTVANDYDHYLRFAMSGCRFLHLQRFLYSVRWHGPSRKTGQHTNERHKTLFDESAACAHRARNFLACTLPA